MVVSAQRSWLAKWFTISNRTGFSVFVTLVIFVTFKTRYRSSIQELLLETHPLLNIRVNESFGFLQRNPKRQTRSNVNYSRDIFNFSFARFVLCWCWTSGPPRPGRWPLMLPIMSVVLVEFIIHLSTSSVQHRFLLRLKTYTSFLRDACCKTRLIHWMKNARTMLYFITFWHRPQKSVCFHFFGCFRVHNPKAYVKPKIPSCVFSACLSKRKNLIFVFSPKVFMVDNYVTRLD